LPCSRIPGRRRQQPAADRQKIAALAARIRKGPFQPDFPRQPASPTQIGTAFADTQAGSPASSAIRPQNGGDARSFRPRRQKDMSVEESLFGIHGKALALRSQRLSLLASNIANASTPGYKARDIDFDAALKEATNSQSGGNTGGVDKAVEDSMGYRVPLQPSLDGNTVELSTEQTLFAENAVKYRTTLSFLEGRINTISRAFKGE
jgi:flagellar basal-body rod protein FlgB